MSEQARVQVPLESVLRTTAAQRNAALDQVALLEGHVEQLTAERDQLAEQLRAQKAPSAGSANAVQVVHQ